MGIEDFIKKVITDYSLELDEKKTLNYVREQARKLAQNGVACVDDDTVKEWILNGVDDINKIDKKPSVTQTEKDEEEDGEKENKPQSDPKAVVKFKKDKEYEEISLFD